MYIPEQLLKKESLIVAGHRGMKAIYPENTLLSFGKAIDLGVDMLEMDLHLSKDGHLVVIHDATVDRTTNGTGLVEEKTLTELKQLDAGIPFGEEFKGLTIPTFEEFCQLIIKHPHILLNVEFKDQRQTCIDQTIAALSKHNLIQNCVFASFYADTLKYVHQKHDLPTQGFPGFKMHNFEPGLDGTISHMTAVGIEMSLLTPERVQDYEAINVLPWAYCPDDEKSAAYARYCGAWLVTTNNPEPSLRIFKA